MSVEVARVLREARDLMNNDGRHWLKGEMHIFYDVDFEEMNESYENLTVSPNIQYGDDAWCAWGGIKHVAIDNPLLQIEAMEALVRIIDPEGYDSYTSLQDEQFAEWEASVEEEKLHYGYTTFSERYPTFTIYWDSLLVVREDILGDKIAQWNDADKRSWEDVKLSLTKAANKAKAEHNKVTT